MNSSLPPDLLALKSQFDDWRQSRSSKSTIPHHLRLAAIALLDRYSQSTICKACRLHPRSLQSSPTKKSPPPRPSPKNGKPSGSPSPLSDASPADPFFPLPTTSLPHRSSTADPALVLYRLLIERPDGTRLTLVLPQPAAELLTSLCTDFLHF